MTVFNYRSAEPLYLVIVREKNAQQLLQDWAKAHRVQCTIESNRMRLHDNQSFSLFQLHWPHSWETVTIWDCWLRRHIYPI
jgi:hypothetical protein